MCAKAGRVSIFCILPPHVLRSIAERGTTPQRAAALRTLSVDSTFRALRSALAVTPKIPTAVPAGVPAKHRTIFSAANQELIPGTVVATEDAPPNGTDPAVSEAFAGLGATWDFYADVYDRNSIDDEGLALDATVHYGTGYDNAFWNGARMVFGDGDGELFNRFTIALDVIGHELAHGVTEDEAGLTYMYQSGALNESLSDVFGSMIKQRVLNQSASDADWLIGEGLLGAAVQGRALRSMSEPGSAYDDPVLGKDPQPGHMNRYVDTYQDNGGVHINSGIPNRAFYLTAVGMGGYAWERAGRVWYETLRDSAVKPNTGFKRFAKLTVDTAARLYGTGSTEHTVVHEAWRQVGIPVGAPAVVLV
jgi:Zn-dependent metalloprotease